MYRIRDSVQGVGGVRMGGELGGTQLARRYSANERSEQEQMCARIT